MGDVGDTAVDCTGFALEVVVIVVVVVVVVVPGTVDIAVGSLGRDVLGARESVEVAGVMGDGWGEEEGEGEAEEPALADAAVEVERDEPSTFASPGCNDELE